MSGALGHGQFDERDQELERLRGLVRDLELEARGWRQRRVRDNRERRDGGMGNWGEEGSSQFDSCQHRDRSLSWESRWRRNCSHSRESHQCQARSHSRGYANQGSDSPEERQPYNAAMDAMSRALWRAARLPFSNEIERAPMPSRFTWPPFNSYDGKTDPVEHVSHYIHMMSLHNITTRWCVRCYPQVSALRRWDGLMGYEKVPFTVLPSWSRNLCSVCDMQPGATIGGRITIHKDKGRRNPLELCRPVLGAIQWNWWG